MANDPHDNDAADREMLRRLTGQETIMNNDDERDFEEEEFNRRLMHDDWPPPWFGAIKSGSPANRAGHRTAALHLAGMAERSDPEFVPGLGFAALTHAVLALSAPAEPEPDSWRQRAIEAEAALTAIGGILAKPGHPDHEADILHVIRTAGRAADRLITAPGLGIGGQMSPADLETLARTAAEMWQHADPDEASEYLSARQTQVLALADQLLREEYGEDGPE